MNTTDTRMSAEEINALDVRMERRIEHLAG